MGYLVGMGIGSLSRYRRAFMIGGFVIFAGGALLRWHHKRQLESLQSSALVEPGPDMQITWKDDCMSYACRIVGARGHECAAMCERAVEGGSPRTRAERIANACKQQCIADETPTMACRSACLVSEAHRQH
jgi:hypothetical protein